MKEKGKSTGRNRFNPAAKREGVSIAMDQDVRVAIDAAIVLGSFSGKVEMALREWMQLKAMLVQYRDEAQKEAGTPTLLNINAERIYSCSSFQNGYSFQGGRHAEVVQRVIDSMAKTSYQSRGKKWVEEYLCPGLRGAGLIVQIVNIIESDVYDVWVCDSMVGEAGKNCGRCHVVAEVEDWCRKIRERNPR